MKCARTCVTGTVVVGVLLACAAPLHSDVLTLKDGTVHEGTKKLNSPETIGFVTKEGKLLVIRKADIASLEEGDAAPKPPPEPPSEPPKPSEPPSPAKSEPGEPVSAPAFRPVRPAPRRHYLLPQQIEYALKALTQPRNRRDEDIHQRSRDADRLMSACKTVGQAGERRAVEPLIAILKGDPAQQVREEAARALGLIGDRRAVQPLIAALKDEDKGAASAAATALGDIGDPSALPALSAIMRTPYLSGEVIPRHAAVRALANFQDGRVPGLLIEALKSKTMSGSAVEAVGAAKVTAAVPQLIAMFEDPNTVRRDRVADALGKVGDARAVPVLMAALREKKGLDQVARPRVLWALIHIGHPSVKPLCDWLEDRDGRVPAATALSQIKDADAVEPLIAALRKHLGDDPGGAFATAGLKALGNIGDAGAVPFLCELVRLPADKKETWFRHPATRALAAIDDPRVPGEVAALLLVPDLRSTAGECLAKMGERAVEPVIATLRNPDEAVKRTAIRILGHIGDLRAVEPLITVFGEASGSSLQIAVRDALCAIAGSAPRGDDPEALRQWWARRKPVVLHERMMQKMYESTSRPGSTDRPGENRPPSPQAD